MDETPEKIPQWELKKGSIVHIGGLPYTLQHNTTVDGFHEPAWAKPTECANAESPHKPDSKPVRTSYIETYSHTQ